MGNRVCCVAVMETWVCCSNVAFWACVATKAIPFYESAWCSAVCQPIHLWYSRFQLFWSRPALWNSFSEYLRVDVVGNILRHSCFLIINIPVVLWCDRDSDCCYYYYYYCYYYYFFALGSKILKAKNILTQVWVSILVIGQWPLAQPPQAEAFSRPSG